VYIGAGLYRSPKRGNAEEVSALVGLWADIDFAAPVHKKANLPSNEDEAGRILERLPHPPSAIVHSGHGLQCWWLFRKPLAIRSKAARCSAAALVKGWVDYIRLQARRAGGWDVDATGDLARVLRLPGTMNRKAVPAVPVRLLEPRTMNGELVRYEPEDFREFVGSGEAPGSTRAEVGPLRLDPKAKPPADKFAYLLAEDEKFRHTWERSRSDLQDQSPSAFDMSLASIAAGAGWQDQEIVDLLIAARQEHGEDLKLRQGYYRRTIAKVRSSSFKMRRG